MEYSAIWASLPGSKTLEWSEKNKYGQFIASTYFRRPKNKYCS